MANGISLEIAKKHLNAWLTAELEVTTHQSYTIGSRSLTKANLSEIRQPVSYTHLVPGSVQAYNGPRAHWRSLLICPNWTERGLHHGKV